MKLSVERAALIKALGHVHRIVERRNTIPVLSNVLIRAEPAAMGLRATDLDIEVTESIPADVSEQGATTVPAHMLHDIVRKLPEGSTVTLETQGTQVLLRSGRSRFMLSALPEGDFPDLGSGRGLDGATVFDVPAASLKTLFHKTSFAISTEETRYYLNGVYVHAHQDEAGPLVLRAVATDGHRLARLQAPAPDGCRGMPAAIVPRKTVAEVLKLVDEAGDTVAIELTATKIRFDLGSVVLTSKLIDGTFPDYQRVIPTGNDRKLSMDRAAFSTAVDRVATVSSERGRAVKLSLSANLLVLTVTNPDSGTATEEIEVGYDAPNMEVGFNAKYLLDILGQVEGDAVEFWLADPGSPALVRDPANEAGLFVLMPMRV